MIQKDISKIIKVEQNVRKTVIYDFFFARFADLTRRRVALEDS